VSDADTRTRSQEKKDGGITVNWAKLVAISTIVLVSVVAVAWVSIPPVEEEEEIPKPIMRNITIGVIPGVDENDPTYRLLTSIAQDDINSYCEENGIDFRFRFNLSAPVEMAEQALTYTKAFRASGVDMILGYAWSSHLCSGARVYGYNKTMALMTPSASSYVYALRNTTLYHMCILDIDPLVTMLKAMRDRGVEAYLVIENPGYGEAGNLIHEVYHKVKPLGFVSNRTVEYTYGSPVDFFMTKADTTLGEMIDSYGVNQTAVLWLGFPQPPESPGIGGEQFLEMAASYASLSRVTWYMFDYAGGRKGIARVIGDVDAKLKLINLEMVLEPNPIYDRLNRAWVNETNLSGPMGYYNANIYDGLWVLSLSAIRANSTEPLDIWRVLPSVASEYVGATGRCTLNEFGARMGADYRVYAYFEVDGKVTSIPCGSYSWESDRFTWDESLLG
jgi:hypothetical protein